MLAVPLYAETRVQHRLELKGCSTAKPNRQTQDLEYAKEMGREKFRGKGGSKRRIRGN